MTHLGNRGPMSKDMVEALALPSLDAESYTVRRFVTDHCAALGAEYEADFRKDLLRMLDEVRRAERESRRERAIPKVDDRALLVAILDALDDCSLVWMGTAALKVAWVNATTALGHSFATGAEEDKDRDP